MDECFGAGRARAPSRAGSAIPCIDTHVNPSPLWLLGCPAAVLYALPLGKRSFGYGDPMTLERTILRSNASGEARVIAIFSYRYDAHLVPALIENISPFVHGYASFDDRLGAGMLTSEPDRRNALNRAAADMGADWVLAVDPDERFEDALADHMPRLTRPENGKNLWLFNLREMFTPNSWRDDGLWGTKVQVRLYPVAATHRPITAPLHGPWINPGPGFKPKATGLNFYHLRHVSPARTQLRRDLYAAADPERARQSVGYDYLADMRGCALNPIPPGRAYSPAHVDDGGLWGPALTMRPSDLLPDPRPARFSCLTRSLRAGGAASCHHVAGDLAQSGDTDLSTLSAGYALIAGQPQAAQDILAPLLSTDRPPLLAQVMMAEAMVRSGDAPGAAAMMDQALSRVPDSPWLADRKSRLLPHRAPLDAPDAAWRRWAGADATFAEGDSMGNGPMAVIVIGFRGQTGLLRAVRSVLDQDEDCEIVVVNTGGGHVRRDLASVLPQIRLIDVPVPLFVGAARNIGIDASRADYVAFLAGDCWARPGWIAGRMAAHRAGALSVSNPIVPDAPLLSTGAVCHALVYCARDTSVIPNPGMHYGRSYSRHLLGAVGYFAAGARIAEDTEYNIRCDMISRPVWAVGVHTVHGQTASALGLIRDMYDRSRRMFPYTFPTRSKASDMRNRVDDLLTLRKTAGRKWLQEFVSGSPAPHVWWRWKSKALLAISGWSMTLGLWHAMRRVLKSDALAAQAGELIASKPAQAVALSRQAIRIMPFVPSYHVTLGRALQRSGRWEKALASYETALSLAPTNTDALQRICGLLTTKRQGNAAWLRAERAAAIAPLHVWTLLETARQAIKAGLPDLALAHAQTALMIDPYLHQTHSLLAEIHELVGRSDQTLCRRTTAAEIDAHRTAMPK